MVRKKEKREEEMKKKKRKKERKEGRKKERRGTVLGLGGALARLAVRSGRRRLHRGEREVNSERGKLKGNREGEVKEREGKQKRDGGAGGGLAATGSDATACRRHRWPANCSLAPWE